MKVFKLQSAVWKEGKFYVAQCFNVDVSSFGKTKKEAMNSLREALELYFEDVNPAKLVPIQRPELTDVSILYA